jgi:hypothetical protein
MKTEKDQRSFEFLKPKVSKKTEVPTNKTTISYKAMMSSKRLDSFFDEEEKEG